MSRLSHALELGVLRVPDAGRIAVWGPSADTDLSDLPRERLIAVVVVLPRSRDRARAMIARAATLAARVVIDGQKTDGVDAILCEVRTRVAVDGPVSKAHGKVFGFAGSDAFADWAETPLAPVDGFTRVPGIFSADGPDPASALLAAALPQGMAGHVVDLGAGWGYLGRAILECPSVTALDLVEADARALDCALRNLPDPRASFHWADATTWTPAAPVDHVVMNPPFHVGRKGEPELGQSFIRAAARMLRPSGRLWMVANRHLPYEQALGAVFGEVAEIGGDSRFKLFAAARPARAPRR
jgi:16S rRNA (guanine1207-N2)-methyltransferase